MDENLIILSPFILILVFYLTYFAFGKRLKISPVGIKKLFRFHFVVFFLLILFLVLNILGISLIWLWGIKVLAWIWLLSVCLIVVFKRSSYSNNQKGYSDIFLFFPLGLIVSWIIPMLGALICYTFSLFFNTYDSSIVYEDKNFLLKLDRGFLVYDHEPTLYKKKTFIMIKVNEFELPNWNFETPFAIVELPDKKYEIRYMSEDRLPTSIQVSEE